MIIFMTAMDWNRWLFSGAPYIAFFAESPMKTGQKTKKNHTEIDRYFFPKLLFDLQYFGDNKQITLCDYEKRYPAGPSSSWKKACLYTCYGNFTKWTALIFFSKRQSLGFWAIINTYLIG